MKRLCQDCDFLSLLGSRVSEELYTSFRYTHKCRIDRDRKKLISFFFFPLQPDYYRDSPHFRREGEGPCYRLEIPHAKLDYTGTYSVVARNAHGEAKAVISLQIYAKGNYFPSLMINVIGRLHVWVSKVSESNLKSVLYLGYD